MIILDVNIVVDDEYGYYCEGKWVRVHNFGWWFLEWYMMLDIGWLLLILMDQACLMKVVWLKCDGVCYVSMAENLETLKVEFCWVLWCENDVLWCYTHIRWIVAY